MSVEADTLEAPNWLSELEHKREQRLKVRLGHEAGAGAPCLHCSTSCPGLDLHFWRKICKNCKCSKESHDVPDDDIYGWAQFQLLGSKPNKIKTKIVLPGRNNEVELEWAPKGHEDTINKYLQTLPEDKLPVKGSEAAQARKQLLQKQIPIHDIDPLLCHELSDLEKTAMHSYIEHMKTQSVGVGQIIQFNMQAALIADRLAKNVPLSESNVPNLQAERSALLQLESLAVQDQKELDAFFDKIPKPANMAQYLQNQQHVAPQWAREHLLNNQQPRKDANKNLTNYYPQNSPSGQMVEELVPNTVQIGAIQDLEYATVEQNDNNMAANNPLPSQPLAANLNYEPTPTELKSCHKCRQQFENNDFAIFAARSNHYYHANCFKCAGCNQSLADNMYFYDKESDEIYCGRDYAKIRGIPRCKACDELIFVKEYCLAENCTFHIKHFCCFECDEALVGQKYIVEETQPYCLKCMERVKCDRCQGCMQIIKPDEQGANLNGVHFHPTDLCFACKMCRKPLLKAKLLLRNSKLYCSHDCFNRDT